MKFRVKEFRIEKGWTQAQLADIVGTTKGHISEIENGKKNPSSSLLEKIATAFRRRPADLIADDLARDRVGGIVADISRLNDDDKEIVERLIRSLLAKEGPSQSH